ncbi:NAD(P)H-quinone dehydrogenase [Corynebacterium diphtheriae]|nr:NAD(P)H-quinone dehydrogenase [Corynebacterium diphtheriae]
MTRIVIIGGGPAGYEAALAGAKYGAEITIIEDRGLGGAAVINDCVPSKSFIAGANIKTDLRRADDMGLNKGIGEAHLLIDALNNRVQALAYEQSSDIRASMDAHGVRIIDGRGSFDDYNPKQTVHYIKVDRADGTTETIECDLVLIATGATPRILPDAQPDGERILTWRQIYGLAELPEHLIVVGSGVTGAEFVSAFAELLGFNRWLQHCCFELIVVVH